MKTTKGAYTIWREQNPTNRRNMNAVKLSNQRQAIEKWLAQSEKEQIMNDVTQRGNQEQTVMEGATSTAPPNVPDKTPTNTDNTKINDLETEFNEEETQMKNELTVTYHRVKEDVNTHKRPNVYPINKINKEKLASMNKIFNHLTHNEQKIGITHSIIQLQ